jgi:hypothetical protein
MTWQLWDMGRRNQLGSFASRQEAFEAVLSVTRAYPDLVPDLVLDAEDEEGNEVFMATGQALLDLARPQYA